MNNIYKKLINLRLKHPLLRRGKFETLLVFNKVYSYLRSGSLDDIIVAINSGERQPDLEIPLPNEISNHRT